MIEITLFIFLFLILAFVMVGFSTKLKQNKISWALSIIIVLFMFIFIIYLGIISPNYVCKKWLGEVKTIEISKIEKTKEYSEYKVIDKENNEHFLIMNEKNSDKKKLKIGYANVKEKHFFTYILRKNIYFAESD